MSCRVPQDNKFLLLVEVVSVTMCISTFVSHTVAALILMPVIVEVGVKCGNPVLLGMGAALAVSSGCALPFSSFPNVTGVCARRCGLRHRLDVSVPVVSNEHYGGGGTGRFNRLRSDSAEKHRFTLQTRSSR